MYVWLNPCAVKCVFTCVFHTYASIVVSDSFIYWISRFCTSDSARKPILIHPVVGMTFTTSHVTPGDYIYSSKTTETRKLNLQLLRCMASYYVTTQTSRDVASRWQKKIRFRRHLIPARLAILLILHTYDRTHMIYACDRIHMIYACDRIYMIYTYDRIHMIHACNRIHMIFACNRTQPILSIWSYTCEWCDLCDHIHVIAYTWSYTRDRTHVIVYTWS